MRTFGPFIYSINRKHLNHIDQGFCSSVCTFLRQLMKPKQDVSLVKGSNSNFQSSGHYSANKVQFGTHRSSNERWEQILRDFYWHYKHRHWGNYPECSMSSEHKGLLIAPFCRWNMARYHSPMTQRATSLVSVSCHKCIIGFIINIIGQNACWLGYSLVSCVTLLNLWKEKLNIIHLDPPELLFVSAWAGRSYDFSEVFREI